MTRKQSLARIVAAALMAFTPVTAASAHDYRHHHGGGPVIGLLAAAIDVATLPVRVVGGAVATVATAPYYPVQAYAQPVYYAAPSYPAYAYPQPVYAYPQPVYYGP